MLNDPVTAQYTHTLTVSIEGEYTCTVANNKPSSASASITLRGIATYKIYRITLFLHIRVGTLKNQDSAITHYD